MKVVNLAVTLNKLTKDWSFTNINFHQDENLKIAQFEDQLNILENIIKFDQSLQILKT